MEKFAIDLLWVRINQVGGTEFYIRNILDGLLQVDSIFKCVLIISRDNKSSFSKYLLDTRFSSITCQISSSNVKLRILWQNIYLNKLLKKNNIKTCFEPVYSKPFIRSRKINFITTIHDLQALHYPEYHDFFKVFWFKINWWNTVNTSWKIIAISNFVRDDILEKYHILPENVVTIYNAVNIDCNDFVDPQEIINKYNIQIGCFYYTVSSMLPHKNLKTLLKIIKIIKEKKLNLPNRLLISGIGGKEKKNIQSLISDLQIEDNVTLTGFISVSERNSLYKYCHTFLFPSVFEGFGFPPVEAMCFNTRVITTKKASLFEVTQGKALYVDDPYDENEWICLLENSFDFENDYSNVLNVYDKKSIAECILNEVVDKKC
ncbi:MAG: glycosyltransferase family 1 protein [Sphaerochaeta sp.]|nr:glycosyltransferase family 1 protein [Sphaerochaeta sp.]